MGINAGIRGKYEGWGPSNRTLYSYYLISMLCSGATNDLDRPTSNQHILSFQFSAVSRTSMERRSSESKGSKSSLASMSQMKMVEKGKSSSSSEKESCSETTLLVGKTSRQTETSISSSKGVKEICETERKTSSRVKTNSAIVASSTTSCVR